MSDFETIKKGGKSCQSQIVYNNDYSDNEDNDGDDGDDDGDNDDDDDDDGATVSTVATVVRGKPALISRRRQQPLAHTRTCQSTNNARILTNFSGMIMTVTPVP